MQIGSRGRAYGPSKVMSRPTLGRQIRAVPGGSRGLGNVIDAVLNRMPSPPPFNPSVLVNELQRRARAGAILNNQPFRPMAPAARRTALQHAKALIEGGNLGDPLGIDPAVGGHGGGAYVHPGQFGAHVPHVLVPVHPTAPPHPFIHPPAQPQPPQIIHLPMQPAGAPQMLPVSWGGPQQDPGVRYDPAPTTIDPGALLARARLAMLMRQASQGVGGGA